MQGDTRMSNKIPRDAQVIQAILRDMGISEYEPRVVNQLLEFVYRYVTTVLDDAKAYANHAKKKGVDLEDVKLAISLQMDHSFTTPPPREILMEVARAKNSTPLPPVKPQCGLRLPPDCYCLTACNYKLKTIKKTSLKGLGSGVASSPRITSVLGGARGVLRPNSPAVRVASISTPTTTSPRPVIKVNTAPSTAVTSTGATNVPKIQITLPLQISAQDVGDKQSVDLASRGIKREREDDDYDAA